MVGKIAARGPLDAILPDTILPQLAVFELVRNKHYGIVEPILRGNLIVGFYISILASNSQRNGNLVSNQFEAGVVGL